MRNADVHGEDEATRAVAEKQKVTRKVSLIYDDQRQHMEPSAHALLFHDIRTPPGATLMLGYSNLAYDQRSYIHAKSSKM